MPIDFHYIYPSPPCRAVMILGKQLGLELNLINVDLLSGAHKTPEFEAINPRKVVPVINDDGFVLGESRAILTYLINKYSPGHNLYPVDAKKRAQVDRVLYLTAELFERGKGIIKPVVYEGQWPVPDEPKEHYFELLKALELITKDKKFLAGDEMSVADISYICDLTVLTGVVGVDISEVAPGVASWAEKMKDALPEYGELVGEAVVKFKAMVEEKVGHKLE